MFTRLSKKWDYLTQLKNESNGDDSPSNTQELLDEKMNSIITREYSDVIKICLIGGSTDTSEDEVMDQDDVAETTTAHRYVCVNMFVDFISSLIFSFSSFSTASLCILLFSIFYRLYYLIIDGEGLQCGWGFFGYIVVAVRWVIFIYRLF